MLLMRLLQLLLISPVGHCVCADLIDLCCAVFHAGVLSGECLINLFDQFVIDGHARRLAGHPVLGVKNRFFSATFSQMLTAVSPVSYAQPTGKVLPQTSGTDEKCTLLRVPFGKQPTRYQEPQMEEPQIHKKNQVPEIFPFNLTEKFPEFTVRLFFQI